MTDQPIHGAPHGPHCGPGCGHASITDSTVVRRITVADDAASPIMVQVSRGNMVESWHRGRAVAVNADGRVVGMWGDAETLVYPRSANKALQVLPLIESGAADAYGVTSHELALACASHGGQPMHTERVAAWLDRMGLTAQNLECGAHLPFHVPTAEAMLKSGQTPTAVHNNCSGKHAGMLATALHKGEPLKGYVGYTHPVQQRVLGVIEQVTSQDLSQAPWGIDGCAIPTIGIRLGALALGMARLADPSRHLPDRRAEAVIRVRAAWAAHPELIGGTDTFDTRFMQALNGSILIKSGAEAVCCAVLSDHGIGVAVKIDDGSPRAVGPAMAAVLHRLGVLDDAAWQAVHDLVHPPIPNRNGVETGRLGPVAL